MPEKFSTAFVDILIRGTKNRALAQARATAAGEWLKNSIRRATMSTGQLMDENRKRMRHNPAVGNMYLFNYDPKHAKTLPYYDTYPLIFPIEYYRDGFLGINMHYLPPIMRAKLMGALYELLTDTRFNERTKLKISYSILKNAAQYRYFKPCVKRYLKSHVRGRFMRIEPIEWDFVLWTPLARFQKAPITKVWADSRKMVG